MELHSHHYAKFAALPSRSSGDSPPNLVGNRLVPAPNRRRSPRVEHSDLAGRYDGPTFGAPVEGSYVKAMYPG